jgi:hypothetical protein
MATGDKQTFMDASYKDVLIKSNEIMSTLREEIFTKIEDTFLGYIGKYEKHILASLAVLILVVTFGLLKTTVVVLHNREIKHTAKAKKIYYFLLPIALFVNLTSAGVEGMVR